MLTKLDTSNLAGAYRALPFYVDLEAFVDEVALAKPSCTFAIDDECVRTYYDKSEEKTLTRPDGTTYTRQETVPYQKIHMVKVYELGEHIGSLSVGTEYRKGNKATVFGVESFRIQKFRGNSNQTTSIDRKVALRNAKKNLIGRDSAELAAQIRNMIYDRTKSDYESLANTLSYSLNSNNLVADYCVRAYHARHAGEASITMPAIHTAVRDLENHNKIVESVLAAKAHLDMLDSDKGYGVFAYSNGSYAVYDFSDSTVKRYADYDGLPEDVASKLGVFKLAKHGERYEHLGCKYLDHAYLIVAGNAFAEQ